MPEAFKADLAIVGAGGAGLRAAIAVAEADPSLVVRRFKRRHAQAVACRRL